MNLLFNKCRNSLLDWQIDSNKKDRLQRGRPFCKTKTIIMLYYFYLKNAFSFKPSCSF